MQGLTSAVTVLRDERGVPQIYADNAQDLFRAQGFVQAQDRFFEMDLRRHITAGRLSELVGKGGLETDKVIRTLGWRRVAEAELPTLKPETRQYLQAYADGVNAYIDQQGSPSQMALEYVVLSQKVKDYRVEPWTPADSLAWLKAMAWDLRSDYDDELTRARLFGRVPVAQINELYPALPLRPARSRSCRRRTGRRSRVPPPPPRCRARPCPPCRACRSGPRRQRRTRMPRRSTRSHRSRSCSAGADGIGSNSWVVGSEKSSTGKPLLANDPHLGVGIPGIWYQVGLHCRSVGSSCPFDVSGFSFAGLPGVVIGHNQSIAWSMTNLAPDVSDFYLEQVRGGSYQRDGRYVPLEQRQETIKIAGEGDHTITVRSTVHGPILSEALPKVSEAGGKAPVSGRPNAGNYEVSLAWTGLRPQPYGRRRLRARLGDHLPGVPGGGALVRGAQPEPAVRRPSTATSATRRRGRSPSAGPTTPGAVPGYWPTAGWRSSGTGRVTCRSSRCRTTYDPPEGYLVTANQAVTASPTPFLTTRVGLRLPLRADPRRCSRSSARSPPTR